jgi:hypothetical protein
VCLCDRDILIQRVVLCEMLCRLKGGGKTDLGLRQFQQLTQNSVVCLFRPVPFLHADFLQRLHIRTVLRLQYVVSALVYCPLLKAGISIDVWCPDQAPKCYRFTYEGRG